MIITKLVLWGYKRLSLSGVEKLEINPRSPFQIILGRNGCGKSSVLDMLTPLPPAPAQFVKGGGKTIELEAGKNVYTLTSDFKSSNKHSFIINGEELNDGGTGAVQKELVKKHFGITPEIHDLMVGRTTFTSMSPAKRREWVTAMSDTDLTYVLGVYNKLKTKLRDTQGAFKHVSGRLMNETRALETLGDVETLESDVKELEEEVMVLMRHSRNDLPQAEQVMSSLSNNLDDLKQVSEALLSLKLHNKTGFSFSDYSEMEEVINGVRSDKKVTESLLERTSAEFDEYNKLYHELEMDNGGGVDSIRQRRDAMTERAREVRGCIKRFNVDNAADKIADTTEMMGSVIPLLSDMPDNSDGSFSREKLENAQQEVERLTDKGVQLKNKLARLEERRSHIETAKETNCPKCGYRWIEGVSENDLETIGKHITQISEELEETRAKWKEQSEYKDLASQYTEAAHRFRTIVNNYPRLKPLWDSLIEAGWPRVPPASLIPIIYQWDADLPYCADLQQCEKEIEKANLAIESIDNKGLDTDLIGNRQVQLEEELSNLNERKILLGEQERALLDHKLNVDRAGDLHRTMVDIAGQIQKEKALVVDALRGERVSNVLNSHQATLGQYKTKLSEKNTTEALVSDLQNSADELGVDAKALDILVRQMSPQEGLIADQLKGFIETMVGQMNEVISHIWTYDLQVLPCGIESGDLNYKFPLSVQGESDPKSDIANSSSGQQEIINFAFKIVACLYLDLMGYPLYLDELGRTFDEQHRINTVDYVKLLIDAKRYSQVFYISHFACSYGAMSGADILVLDSSNVSVPAHHNQHAKIA